MTGIHTGARFRPPPRRLSGELNRHQFLCLNVIMSQCGIRAAFSNDTDRTSQPLLQWNPLFCGDVCQQASIGCDQSIAREVRRTLHPVQDSCTAES